MSILTVKLNGDTASVTWPLNHVRADKVEKWLNRLSLGYVEWLLRFGRDPHCSNCRDMRCDNVGMGDDACPAFKFGTKW